MRFFSVQFTPYKRGLDPAFKSGKFVMETLHSLTMIYLKVDVTCKYPRITTIEVFCKGILRYCKSQVASNLKRNFLLLLVYFYFREALLLFANRHESDILWRDELDSAAEFNENR